MIEDCVIIGGGVAGLSAANQLIDAGLKPLIIEASKYPAQRVCGEFFSHECLPILSQWDIPMHQQISFSRFYKGEKKIEFALPIPSKSCSRYLFDSMLLERAITKGVRALTETSVKSLNTPSNSNQNYELLLSDGQSIKARHLIIGTGRIPKLGQQPPTLQYVGFKAHFEWVDIDDAVQIHTFAGGYLGISPINSTTTNIAWLVKKECIKNLENPELSVFDQKSMLFLKQRLQKSRMIFPNWLVSQIPEFGIRQNPSLERVFWIGDAAGSIPPVCGEGLAIAITSGVMAADYLLKSNAQEFKVAWLKKYQKRFFLAQQIHKIILSPSLANCAFLTCRIFPFLPKFLWKQTR